MAPCAAGLMLASSLLGSLFLAAANPAIYPASSSGVYATMGLPTGATFSIYQDLQTWTSAAASCQTSNSSDLASIVSSDEWNLVASLTASFWASANAKAYLSAPTTPAAAPGKPGSVGWQNHSLFQGCVWLGLANLNNTGSPTYAASADSFGSLAFTDGALLSSYLTNLRASPVQTAGWPLYGQPPPLPVNSTTTTPNTKYDIYATCAMACPNLKTSGTALQATLGYTPVTLAGCSTIALPYLCKTMQGQASEPEVPAERRRSRSLLQQQWRGRSTSHEAAAAPAGEGEGEGAGEAAAATLSYTQEAVVKEEEESTWPPTPTMVNTILPNGNGTNAAKCVPAGQYEYCTFPSTVRLTQPDWMYVCWQAGLEPLDANSYAALTVLMAANKEMTLAAALPPAPVDFVFTQSSLSSYSPLPVNLFSEAADLASYLTSTTQLPSPGLPNYPTLALPIYNATANAAPTSLPGYAYVNTGSATATCGADGYGLGCAVAVAYKNGVAVGLATIGASTLANGMCQRPNDKPSPRPANGAKTLASVMFHFVVTNTTAEAILGSALANEEFATAFAKEAIPAALPGVGPVDVAIATGGPVIELYNEVGEGGEGGEGEVESGDMTLGLMLVITLPFTVNNTSTVNTYLQNLYTNMEAVIPRLFWEENQILEAWSVLSSLSGNVDAPPVGDSTNIGVSVGVGLGVGIPLVAGVGWYMFKFIKEANAMGKAHRKEDDDGL